MMADRELTCLNNEDGRSICLEAWSSSLGIAPVDKETFNMLEHGILKDVWKYLTSHVASREVVAQVKGNLKLEEQNAILDSPGNSSGVNEEVSRLNTTKASIKRKRKYLKDKVAENAKLEVKCSNLVLKTHEMKKQRQHKEKELESYLEASRSVSVKRAAIIPEKSNKNGDSEIRLKIEALKGAILKGPRNNGAFFTDRSAYNQFDSLHGVFGDVLPTSIAVLSETRKCIKNVSSQSSLHAIWKEMCTSEDTKKRLSEFLPWMMRNHVSIPMEMKHNPFWTPSTAMQHCLIDITSLSKETDKLIEQNDHMKTCIQEKRLCSEATNVIRIASLRGSLTELEHTRTAIETNNQFAKAWDDAEKAKQQQIDEYRSKLVDVKMHYIKRLYASFENRDERMRTRSACFNTSVDAVLSLPLPDVESSSSSVVGGAASFWPDGRSLESALESRVYQGLCTKSEDVMREKQKDKEESLAASLATDEFAVKYWDEREKTAARVSQKRKEVLEKEMASYKQTLRKQDEKIPLLKQSLDTLVHFPVQNIDTQIKREGKTLEEWKRALKQR